jgi:anti-anti-sigma factor
MGFVIVAQGQEDEGGAQVRNSLPMMPRSGEFALVADWPDETTLLVRMHGALDFYSVREAKQLLLEQLERRPRRVVIDVSDAFVDSSGIGLLIYVAQRVQMERGVFRVACDERLDRLLQIHQLDKLIPIAQTADDALEQTLVHALPTGGPAFTGNKDGDGRRHLRRVA